MVNLFEFLRIHGDLLVLDGSGDPMMLVIVQAQRPIDQWSQQQAVEALKRARLPVPYLMLVDRQSIDIYGWDGEKLSEPLCQFATASVLRHYDHEYGLKEIFGPYLATLIESWLRDLAYHWKSDVPPGADRLAAIGIMHQLHDGTTVSASEGAV